MTDCNTLLTEYQELNGYKLIESNECHMAHLEQEASYYYSMGGRWSAKTYEVLQKAVEGCLTIPGLQVLACRKVSDTLRDSLYRDTLGIIRNLDVLDSCTPKVSPLCIGFDNGSYIAFKGIDDFNKKKGIANFDWLILDELNEFTLADFETLDLGLRGQNPPYKRFLMHNPIPLYPVNTDNPMDNPFWFKDMFDPGYLDPGEPVLYHMPAVSGKICGLKTTYKHNKFCPAEIREKLEHYKNTNPELYELWAKGKYTKLKGVIFDNWDIVESIPPNVDFIGYGLDFGYAIDPAALIAGWIKGYDIYLKGLLYSVGLSNKLLYDLAIEKGVGAYDEIIADSEDPKSIDDLYNYGLYGIRSAKKKAGYILDMVRVLKSFKIHLLVGDIDLEREFSVWCYKKDKNGRTLPVPCDGFDHYIKAFIMLMHERRERLEEMAMII